MKNYILGFGEIDKTMLATTGGKGASLGELSGIEGIQVPDGFCVSVAAFKRVVGGSAQVSELLDELSYLKMEERDKISALSRRIRKTIEDLVIPADIREEIAGYLAMYGEADAYAIRSSATAEDLPNASFAGQQDTYLNITGLPAMLQHISKCWASLFTDRAVIYRMQQGFDQRKVHLAVVVQKMVFPQAAGILFTADPLTGNRKVVSIDAGFGLGEALVSGLVNPDNYKVRDHELIGKQIAVKKLAVYAGKEGGTHQHEIEPELQQTQVLTDEQIIQLERSGRKIEAHFGSPQDIEWCLAGDVFYMVQSRPITTLFPVPESNDTEKHVYVSVGHQQMMTDAMKPLGLSFFLLTAHPNMRTAAGRLFIDIAHLLATPTGRQSLMNTLGKSDPLIKDALTTIMERNYIPTGPTEDVQPDAVNKTASHLNAQLPVDNDPAIAAGLISRSEASIVTLKQDIRSASGMALLDFIREDIGEMRKLLSDPQSMGAILAGMNASAWINEKMMEWLGEKNVADTIAQSVPGNITSEMGLALLDVADVIRPYPEVIRYLQNADGGSFPDDLLQLKGGLEARQAILTYLDRYGMRCAGEIDITRSRWSEEPRTLIPVILGNIRNFNPGAGRQKFDQGLQASLNKEQDLLARLAILPEGDQKVAQTKRMIDAIRNFSGYREYPKYSIVSRYFVYKQALMKEADLLVRAGLIPEAEDIYYLSFDELREAMQTRHFDEQLICKRKEEFKIYEQLNPPRMITSEGEIITGKYLREDLPEGAIAGLAVSSGVVEGRARVIPDLAAADLEEGDILVTVFTDPSWTPLFVSIKGLVTEVGGIMTHGAVIAREYGLPAVVSVENATGLIKDGQRIRVNGTDGYVEII